MSIRTLETWLLNVNSGMTDNLDYKVKLLKIVSWKEQDRDYQYFINVKMSYNRFEKEIIPVLIDDHIRYDVYSNVKIGFDLAFERYEDALEFHLKWE